MRKKIPNIQLNTINKNKHDKYIEIIDNLIIDIKNKNRNKDNKLYIMLNIIYKCTHEPKKILDGIPYELIKIAINNDCRVILPNDI
jgi:hypothetical protein